MVTRYESLVFSMVDLQVNCTYTRSSIVVNGTSPGPTLRFNTNERVIINVTNLLVHENVTMHWHGLSMSASPASDGTPSISQWPIAPGNWFQYEFFLGPEDEGTYFYHSHVGMQLTTAHGALIVSSSRPCHPEAPRPQEMIMLVSDYWHKTDSNLIEGLLSDPFIWTNSSNAIFLNGLGVGTSTEASCPSDYPVFDVLPGTTYRLRWIHAGSLMYVSVGIENHTLSLIEADGTDLIPTDLDHLEFAPGQRYSTIIKTKSRAQVREDGRNGLYVIKLSSRWRSPGLESFAVLRYSLNNTSVLDKSPYIQMRGDVAFEKSKEVYALPPETYDWYTRRLHALIDSPPPRNINKTLLVVEIQQAVWGMKGLQWKMNGKTYHETNLTENKDPILVQLYKSLHNMTNGSARKKDLTGYIYDAVKDIYALEAGQVIDIILVNLAGPSGKTDLHPMHMHGRKFWVMAAGPGNYSERTLERDKVLHPYRRDTVNIYPGPGFSDTIAPGQAGGYVLIRYEASARDAGVFPLHCHIVPHLVMGQAVILTVAPSELPDLVESYEPFLNYRGEAYGNASWTPAPPIHFVDKTVIEEQDLGNERFGCEPSINVGFSTF